MKPTLNARVEPELKSKLEELAKKERMTLSSLTELLLKEYLENRLKIKNFESIIEFEKSMAQLDVLHEISRQEFRSRKPISQL